MGISLMRHAIYHSGLDTFVYRKKVDYDREEWIDHSREKRFLFCEFVTECLGPKINIYDEDLDHLLMCQAVGSFSEFSPDDVGIVSAISADHVKLYTYLFNLGLEYIRFIPWDENIEGESLNWKRSFTLKEWSLG